MQAVPDIRDLSRRAELEFHERAHPQRRRDWWRGLVWGALCLLFVAVASFRGNREIYSAGPLSSAHAFIANDCRQCHTAWKPASRLINFTNNVHSVENSSIDNQACLKCHAASEHHANQVPAHSELSCAACHREHRGKQVLAKVTDQHCIQCHADLKTTDGLASKFAHHVTGFDEAHGHPEFHLWRRLASSTPDQHEHVLVSQHEVDLLAEQRQQRRKQVELFSDVLKPRQADEVALKNSSSELRDRTELKFNHASHFHPERIFDRDGRHEDLAKNCQKCHVMDAAGELMQPVKYAAHCARCHALFFDNDNHPNQEVPHERMEIVRGFLTETFTLAALKNDASKPLREHQPVRPLPGPGESIRQTMNAAQATDVEQRVAKAEKFVLDHTRQQVQGGCKLCHTVQQKLIRPELQKQNHAEQDSLEVWFDVVPPVQPERWMRHSRFDHAAHRTFDCLQCHYDVPNSRPERESAQSPSAADVLIPRIADCQACHVSKVSQPRAIKPEATLATYPVVSSCVKCHQYHRRDGE
jgi:hypothetical protein